MIITATRTPTSGAWYSNADDNLRLTKVDPYHALVRAIIARAYWDSIGRVGTAGMTEGRRYMVMQDAIEFFKDGRCLHLVECIGCDPELLGALGLNRSEL